MQTRQIVILLYIHDYIYAYLVHFLFYVIPDSYYKMALNKFNEVPQFHVTFINPCYQTISREFISQDCIEFTLVVAKNSDIIRNKYQD